MCERQQLRPDTPLRSPEQDRLGYANFAEQLAETVGHRTPTNGYTIGIHGQWGSGKSTILYFLEHYLEESDSSPVIVRFNPWWFSGEADLLDKFMTELTITLESEDDFPDIKPHLAKLSGALSEVPFEAFTGVPVGRGFGALASVLDEENEGIEDLKQTIDDELEEIDRKIVVIIDDIDRLTPEGITQMFRIINNIADFPNLVYILAFDRSIVSNSLEKEANLEDGDQYLQKIVQLPLHIPKHRKGALELLFDDEISKIDDEFTIEEDRWDSLLRNGIMPILETPREVIRLANTTNVMYAAISDEVNFTDLVGLETLRVFYPGVYSAIKTSSDRFVGRRLPVGRFGSSDTDDYNDVLGHLDSEERQAAESILKLLFPLVRDNLLDQHSSQDWDEMRVNKRICHPDRFPVYFRLDIPEGQLSAAEIGAIMATFNDAEQFAEELVNLLEEEGSGGFTKANMFLRRLQERIDGVNPDEVDPILTAIFKVGDEIIRETPLRSRNREAARISFLVESALEQQDESVQLDTLTSAISAGESPYIASYVLRGFLRSHGEYDAEPVSEDDRLFELADIDEIRSSVVECIEEASQRGDLIEVHWLKWPLEYWAESSDSDELEAWVQDIVETENGLLKFIDGMSATTTVNRTTPRKYIDPRWLDAYLDLDEVEERIEAIDREELDDEKEDIVARFERGMDLLEAGRDPSSAEVWIIG